MTNYDYYYLILETVISAYKKAIILRVLHLVCRVVCRDPLSYFGCCPNGIYHPQDVSVCFLYPITALFDVVAPVGRSGVVVSVPGNHSILRIKLLPCRTPGYSVDSTFLQFAQPYERETSCSSDVFLCAAIPKWRNAA